jgi:hypothetical protein
VTKSLPVFTVLSHTTPASFGASSRPTHVENELTEEDLRRFVEACADPTNTAAQETMLVAGASSATGVLARILLSDATQRARLIELVHRAIGKI